MYKTMIIDDDIATLYILKRFKKWEENGFSVKAEACDGKEALKLLNEQQYDLIITDIKMPGMDGIELLQELRDRSSDICVIFLSTHSDFEYAKKGIRLGVFDYMTKPLEDETLSEILKRAKTHLDSKYDKVQDSNKEDSTGLYYPKNREESIINMVLNVSSELENEALETFDEIYGMLDEDSTKTKTIINTMLYNIISKVDETYPWLGEVESISGNLSVPAENSTIVIKNYFIRILKEVSCKIQKYELNHPDSVIQRICRYIIENIENGISLEKVANEVHISRDYVGKLFKQKVQCNFNDYVTKVKMERAKQLLLTGDYKNYEVCEKLGYKKTDYFTSLFKEYTGFTPSEYKKMVFREK
jgi:two-component system response regulator YesN